MGEELKTGWNFLRLPATEVRERGEDRTVLIEQREILRRKPFLRRVYLGFYRRMGKVIGPHPSPPVMVELGSGGGFIKELFPRVVTSDIVPLPHVDQVFSAIRMPFADGSIDFLLMTNVFHHIPDAHAFLREAARCLRVGGKLIMIEPANTPWARLIWKNFHHEPFHPEGEWEFIPHGPLSSANGALPWIVFVRDSARFQEEFPSLRVQETEYHTPFLYLLSGGFTLRQLFPLCLYGWVQALEKILKPWSHTLGMFTTIVVQKEPS